MEPTLDFLENSQLNSSSTQLLANVMATVENMKKEMIKADETHTSRVESVKKELANVMTTVENLKIDTDAGKFNQFCYIFSL